MDDDVVAEPPTGIDSIVTSIGTGECSALEITEDLEAETYSTDAGSEGDADADRKRRRPRRKRRPKPEAIAARLKTDADAEGVAEAAAPGAASDAGA